MNMRDDFVDIYTSIKVSEKEFLLEFMFQLTIIGRQLHSELKAEPLSSASKQISEINHRVLNRIKGMDGSDSFFNKEYLMKMVPHHVGLAPEIDDGVVYAAKKAYAKSYA